VKIFVFNPGSEGGIAKYGWHQARALGRLGCETLVLCDRGQERNALNGVTALGVLAGEQTARNERSRPSRACYLIRQCLSDQLALFHAIISHRPDAVLLASYVEYLSPAWVWLQLLAKNFMGVTFVADLHDPVRDFVVGPVWWHKLSVGLAYRPLSAVFVHEQPPHEAGIPSHVRICEVPHGLYPTSVPTRTAKDVRHQWSVPEVAVVFLSFGFIRDSKNIDLLIRALTFNPDAYLVVMGRVQSVSSNRPVVFYQQLAKELKVDDRVQFVTGFVPDSKLADYFNAADAYAMTYSKSFRSQSGVLNTAAAFAKPVLASSGSGPLRECVERFGLGIFVAPDAPAELARGMSAICRQVAEARSNAGSSPYLSGWEAYRRYASWENNATVVLDAIKAARKE
jgi:glycosyltransferase involved in cell wall biosynthesis